MPSAGRVLVRVGDEDIMGIGLDVADGEDFAAGLGVQVGGISNGVAVEICSAGPSGSFHFPRHSQMTSPIKEQARTERKERIAFWEFVIRFHRASSAWRQGATPLSTNIIRAHKSHSQAPASENIR